MDIGMQIFHFVYEVPKVEGVEHTPYVQTVDMIVTGTDKEGRPYGYEAVREAQFAHGTTRWTVMDYLTVLVHPILERRVVGTVGRVET